MSGLNEHYFDDDLDQLDRYVRVDGLDALDDDLAELYGDDDLAELYGDEDDLAGTLYTVEGLDAPFRRRFRRRRRRLRPVRRPRFRRRLRLRQRRRPRFRHRRWPRIFRRRRGRGRRRSLPGIRGSLRRALDPMGPIRGHGGALKELIALARQLRQQFPGMTIQQIVNEILLPAAESKGQGGAPPDHAAFPPDPSGTDAEAATAGLDELGAFVTEGEAVPERELPDTLKPPW